MIHYDTSIPSGKLNGTAEEHQFADKRWQALRQKDIKLIVEAEPYIVVSDGCKVQIFVNERKVAEEPIHDDMPFWKHAELLIQVMQDLHD